MGEYMTEYGDVEPVAARISAVLAPYRERIANLTEERLAFAQAHAVAEVAAETAERERDEARAALEVERACHDCGEYRALVGAALETAEGLLAEWLTGEPPEWDAWQGRVESYLKERGRIKDEKVPIGQYVRRECRLTFAED